MIERDYQLSKEEIAKICEQIDAWGSDLLSDEKQQVECDLKYFEYNIYH